MMPIAQQISVKIIYDFVAERGISSVFVVY